MDLDFTISLAKTKVVREQASLKTKENRIVNCCNFGSSKTTNPFWEDHQYTAETWHRLPKIQRRIQHQLFTYWMTALPLFPLPRRAGALPPPPRPLAGAFLLGFSSSEGTKSEPSSLGSSLSLPASSSPLNLNSSSDPQLAPFLGLALGSSCSTNKQNLFYE